MNTRSEPWEIHFRRWEVSDMIELYAREPADVAPLFTDSKQLGRLIDVTSAFGPYVAFDNIDTHQERPQGCSRIHGLVSFRCLLCPKVYAAPKTLNRHMRTKHNENSKVPCFHCGDRFARQDIVIRHMREKHSGPNRMQQCKLCWRFVGPRSLKQHMESAKCQKARGKAPSYLAAIAEPVLLAAWMFVKYKPWGEEHRWMDPHTPPPESALIAIEVLELTGLVYRKIMEALKDPNAYRDWALTDAITLLMLFICQTEGWEASRPHIQGLVRLTAIRLEVSGDSAEDWVMNTTTAEVFDMVLSRDVAGPAVSTCAAMFARAIKLMHQSAVDIIQAPRSMSEKNVWTRVQCLQGADWFSHYGQEVKPIAALASSIPRGESRCRSSPDRMRQVPQGSVPGVVARTQLD